MSLLNVFLSSSRALVGVDTEAVDYSTGRYFSVSKMVHLPHANVVIACRGIHGFMLMLFGMVSQLAPMGKTGDDFDTISQVFPETFDAAYKAMLEQWRGARPAFLNEQQIMLVGWSSQQNRMRAIFYSKASPSDAIEVTEVQEPGYMAPWNETWGESPEGSDSRAMEELAKAQTLNAKREMPNVSVGGRLILAELTRHGMHCHSPCNLPATQKGSAKKAGLVFTSEDLRRIEDGNADPELLKMVKLVRESASA